MNPPPGPNVAIYELTREWTTYRWLCEPCLAATKAEGWTAKYRAPVAQACDRCPAVTSPHKRPDGSVAYAPTSAHAFAPGPNWKRDKALPPWPKPKARPPQRKAA